MTEQNHDLASRFEECVYESLDQRGIADKIEIDMRAHSQDDRLILDELIATPMGEGYGTAALREILAVADQWGVMLEVKLPDDLDDEDDLADDQPGLDTLRDWYVRHGFTMTEDGGVYHPDPLKPEPK